MDPEFAGKVVVVTGSSSGIGAGTALHFASLGANVVVTGRNKEKVKNVTVMCQNVAVMSQNVSSNKAKFIQVVADLSKEEDIKHLIHETIKTFGRIDVLINNAGVGLKTEIEEENLNDKYDHIMNTNVRAVMLLCHYAVPHLEKSKGNIVNISSVASTKPHPKFFVYCMAKSAIDMLTKCLNIDLGKRGIRVNCVSPAVVKTNFFEPNFGLDEENAEKQVYAECYKNYTMQRPGEPKDIAEAIAFLASEKRASWISGSVLDVDGGSMWTSKGPVD